MEERKLKFADGRIKERERENELWITYSTWTPRHGYEHQDTTNDQNMIHHDTNYVYKLRININMVDILKTKLLMITFFI